MIKYIMIPAGILAGSAAALYFCMHPENRRKHLMRSRFGKYYIAHRGLFDNPDVVKNTASASSKTSDREDVDNKESLIPENSLAAFEEAVSHGYGIELDVQLTADNKLVVFHDNNLKRMCGDPRLVRDLTYEELKEFRLAGTQERIPLLKEALKLIDGRVPLFVEIKPEGRYFENTRRTSAMLKKYKGIYCVQSFNPFVLLWFRKYRPEVLRGQLSTDFKKDGDKHQPMLQFLLSDMLFNCFSRPDFISYNHKHSQKPSFRLCTRVFNSLNAAWTIRSNEELEAARKDFEFFIFDSFRP